MKKLLLLASLITVSFLFIKFDIIRIPALESILSNQNQERIFTFKANVQYIRGSAWNIVDGRKVELKEEDTLDEGASIQTDSNTYLVLSLDDGSIIRIGPNTSTNLISLVSNDVMIENRKGSIFSRVNKDKKHLYTVIAGNISVSAMGTVFSVENEEDVKVNVFESTVVVNDSSGDKVEVEENNKWEKKADEVTKLTDEDIQGDKFIAWSLEEEKVEAKTEKKVETETKVEPKPQPVVVEELEEEPTPASISMSGKAVDNGVYLEWKVNGINTAKGFKIVKSQDKNPSFPENGYVYVDDSSARHYTVSVKDGNTWHFRVCQYLGGSCGVYSNDVEVKAPENDNGGNGSGEVSSIKLTVTKKSDEKVKLTWTVDGESDKGFKVVWSRNEHPTYPLGDGDNFHYLSSSGAREDTIDDLDDGKKYYFRVCEYLGGKCGRYSNEVSLEM